MASMIDEDYTLHLYQKYGGVVQYRASVHRAREDVSIYIPYKEFNDPNNLPKSIAVTVKARKMINEELWNHRIHQATSMLQQPGVTLADIAGTLKVTEYVARCVLVSGVMGRSGFQPSATGKSKPGCRQYPLDFFRPTETEVAIKLLGRDPRHPVTA